MHYYWPRLFKSATARLVAVLLVATTIVFSPSGNQEQAFAADPGASSEIDYALNLSGADNSQGFELEGYQTLPQNTSFTVEVWVRPDSLSNRWNQVVHNRGGSNYGRFDINIGGGTAESNRVQVIYAPRTSDTVGASNRMPTELTAPIGEWTHLAVSVVISGSSYTLNTFKNGQLIESHQVTGVTFQNLFPNLYLGYFSASDDRAFDGQIDQLKIWDTALSEAQVAESMHLLAGGVSGSPQLRAAYDFNSASTTAYDRVGAADLASVGTIAFADVKNTVSVESDTVITFPRTYLPGVGGWVRPTGVSQVQYLVVGGGGGGGSYGGGGAGEFLSGTATLTGSAQTIVVGQGGAGVSSPDSVSAGNGGKSSLNSLEALGGGRGGQGTGGIPPTSGGSGGGGGGDQVGASAGLGSGFQSNGGSGGGSGGGGGGAGDVGMNGSSTKAGDGGPGKLSTIRDANGEVFAAGGGGGIWSTTANAWGLGGSGIGGDGGARASATYNLASPGVANTGSGGGGAGYSQATGADGGSGVVIIRYSLPKTLTLDNNGITTTQQVQPGAFPNDPAATRIGYTLLGWSDADDNTAEYAANLSNFTMPSADDTLYAVWRSDLVLVLDATDTNSYSSGTSITNLGSHSGGGTISSVSSAEIAVTGQAFDFPDNNDGAYVDLAGTMASNQFNSAMTIDFYGSMPLTASANGAWARVLDFAVGNGSSTPGASKNLVITRENTDPNLQVQIHKTGPGDYETCKADNVLDGNLKRFTIILDGSSCQFWVDNLDGTGSTRVVNNTTPNVAGGYKPIQDATWDNLYIARSNFAGNGWNEGSLRSIRIFASALTPTQIDSVDSGDLTYKTVNLNADGGSLNSTPSSLVTSGTLALPSSGPTRAGYTFAGWAESSGGSDLGGSITPSSNPDTVFALWSASTNTVTWDSNGGSAIGDSTFTTGGTIAKPTSPTKAGKVFVGWSTSETSDQGEIGNRIESWPYSSPATSNIALYAIWYEPCVTTPSTYEISGTSYNSISVLSGSDCAVALPAGVTSVDTLLVGGGGGGGENVGAGGAGGGVFYKSGVSVSGADGIIISVGDGGRAGKSSGNPTVVDALRDGGAGGNSTVDINGLNYFANGGSGGQTHWASDICGAAGAVGSSASSGGAISAGSDSGGQGASGGAALATGSGQAGSPGGAGYNISFFASSIVYGSGGGGGSWGTATPASGGSGAGAGAGSDGGVGSPGLANRGGGGGGGSSNCASGGAGGSGLVAFRYLTPISITTPTSGLSGTVNSAFTLNVASGVSGGTGGNSYAVTTGTLPAGLSINSSTGVISGTPTAAGDSSIAVTVTDNSTATATTSSFTISIAALALSNVGTPTVSATSGTLKSIDVSWTSVANASSYSLKIYDAAGTTLLDTISLANNLTSYTVTAASGSFENIANGTQYQLSLTAIGTGNYVTSNESAKASVTTLAAYAVSFNANGATTGTIPAAQVKIEGVTLQLASNSGTLAKTGYTFAGWNTQADGQGTDYAAGANYTTDAILTLFAKWTPTTNTVTWDSNGGSSVTNSSFLTGGTLAKPTDPTKTDKIFGGWSTSETSNQGDISNRITSWPYSPSDTSGFTLYAIWLSVAPPQTVSAAAANQSLLVQWTAPSTAATEVPTGYQVEWSTTGTATGTWNVSSSSIAANATSHTITGLTNGTNYYVRVAALYNGAKGAYGYPWTKLYEVASPSRDANNLIVYANGFGLGAGDAAATKSSAAFSRVRYLMNATYSGQANWADVDFDRVLTTKSTVSQNLSNVGVLRVPSIPSPNDFAIQGDVTDMRVQSSESSVDEGVGINGRLEIWPWNYSAGSNVAFSDGDDSAFDYSDTTVQPSGDYGSFQVHNLDGTPQTVLAWNMHRNNGGNPNIGFGNNSTGTGQPDWTYSDREETDFSLEIFANIPVAPAPDTYTIVFNYNGADGGTRPVDADYTVGGTAITLPTPTISDGRLFGGWYSDSALTTFVGYAGDTYTPAANGNLYARWTNLLINLDGANSDSLANNGTTWTSVLPGASNAQGAKTGNAAYFASGSIEGFEFDNSGDAVVFPTNTGNITGQTTLEMWIQPSSLRSGWNLLASKWFDERGNGSNGTYQWHLAIKKEGSNPLRLNAYTSSNGTSYALTNAYGDFEFSPTDTKWYLVGFTIDASNNLQFYVNGQKDGSPHAGAAHAPRASQLWIGDARTSTGFAGKVSEFRLYNKALSATEMQSSFAGKATTYGLATIELNKGDNGVGESVTGYKYDGAGFTLPDSATANSYFTRTGHTVTAWSTNPDGSTSDYALGASYTTNANEVFYPVWTADTYTVTYKAGDGATGSDQTATKTHDVDLTLANKATAEGWFTKSNHEITGWSINSDGSTTDYALGATYSDNLTLTLYPVWETTTIEASHDTYVQSGSGANSKYGSNSALLFKNASNSTSNSYNRVSYVKFEYDAAFNWSGAALEVYVSGNSDGSRNNGYNVTYTTFNVDIYGMNQSTWDESTLTFNLANSSTQDWGLNTGVWPWNPDGGTYLGTISIPTSSSTVGQKFALSNSDLDTFLNADPDGIVTFYMRRSDVDNQANLAFASSEHPSMPGPSLALAGSGYEYTIAYDINGGTGTLPASGKFVEGSGNDYTIADTTGITPPANKVLSGWNTRKDGNGTNYAPGATYNSTSSLTLYAKFVDYPKVTFKSNYVGGPADIQQSVTPSTNTALRLNSFTRTGHTFAGWDTQSDGNGTDYADGADINLSADDELFAQWTANTYTVNYEYWGGTEPNSTTQATFTVGSGSPITLPTPTRDGYTFDGWYVGVYLTKIGNAGATYEPSSNVTLNAKWNAVDYSLTYATTNGTGTSPTDSANYNIGQSAVVKANTSLTRTGYDFAGWVLDLSDGSETPKNAGDTITFSTSNITLYPKWTPATYTITYDANGSTAGSLPKPSDSFTTEGANVDLPDAGTLAKTGHNFGGWSLTPTGAAVADSFSTTQNVILYAVWTIKPVNLTYDKGLASTFDPGVTVPGVSSSTYGSLVTLGSPSSSSIDVLAPAGVDHEFFGWSDGATTYQPGQSVRLGESNLTLTAQWLRVYQVRYALNGGTLAPGDFVHDTECGSSPDWICAPGQINANSAPTRAGYNFTGWKDQAGADIEAGAPFSVDNDTYLLYAQWQAINYNFSFNSLGGSVTTPSVSKTVGQLLTLPSPGTKTGYTFSGWTDGVLTYQAGSQFTVGTSSKAFQAVWTPNIYTVTYDWQGGKVKTGESVKLSDSYTVGSGNMSLPSGTTYERDGYNFAGWATSAGGSAVTNYQPTTNVTLYARWEDGNYTLTYNPKGGDAGGASGTVGRGSSVTLPTPTRAGFVFNGWFDAPSGGNKIGNGGDSHNPGRSKTLYANWVQRSLFGVDLADLDTAANLSIGSGGTGGSFTKNSSNGTSASVAIPNGSLPENTTVTARYFKDLQRQADLIEGDNNYIFSLLVSWITGDGDTATVPDTDPTKPITVTITSDAIKAGQSIYQVIGDQVTFLGKATLDGSASVDLYEDPEIVLVATAPSAPTGVTVTAGTNQATVSWTAPSDGGSPITGYTVTSNPGSLTCTTTGATSCVVPGLTDGTSYTFSVTATNSVGTSASSSSSSSISPLAPTYTVTYNSNGGSAVSSATFLAGATLSAPASPTRSGYTFDGWSTTLNDASTKVTFPYTAADLNLTFFALWIQNQSGGGTPSQPVVVPPVTPTPDPTPSPTPGPVAPPSQIGFEPTPPATPVSQTGPVGNVVGSSQQVTITADAPKENLVASGLGWQIKVRVEEPAGNTVRIQENLGLQSPMTGTTAISATGLRPNTYVEVWAFSEETYIGTLQVGADGQLTSELELPDTLLPGEHTLQIGTLNTAGQLITLSIPLTVKGKVTVGTFKGYIAIYTADIHGQRLSAKVAGKWVVQDPISRYKRFTYSRLVRFTGAGYDIIVDVYINRKFYERSTTRTR